MGVALLHFAAALALAFASQQESKDATSPKNPKWPSTKKTCRMKHHDKRKTEKHALTDQKNGN